MNQSTANEIRYFTLSLQPAHGLVHPTDDALVAASDLTRESLSHICIRDGTSVLYYRLQGTPTAIEEVLAERSDVVLYDIIGERDGFSTCISVSMERAEHLTSVFSNRDSLSTRQLYSSDTGFA